MRFGKRKHFNATLGNNNISINGSSITIEQNKYFMNDGSHIPGITNYDIKTLHILQNML